ncbi:arrestin [Thozetella sp. PMI_491]|nr:arrestin [Thozetella sp. PMI_491]
MAGLPYSYHRQQAIPSVQPYSPPSRGGDDSSSLGTAARKTYPRTRMEITLDNFYTSKVYTSGSSRDVPFDVVQIVLMGQTKTRVDGLNTPHEVTHTFLKMVMPIPESTYPVPRVLEAGEQYSIPFHFVIPYYLTVNACGHRVSNEHVRDKHVLIPPSMGDWEKSDMGPAMAGVEYSIKARIFRDEDQCRRIKIIETSQRINVLPASFEEPPLSLTRNDVLYKMTKSKAVRKNLLSSKQGQLSAEAIQPSAVFLKPDGRCSSGTAAQVALTFDPSSADAPTPEITGVSGKVTAHTFFSSGTIANFPNLGDWNQQFSEKRGDYRTSSSLGPIAIDKPRWLKHNPSATRRDSGYSSCNEDDAAEVDSLNSGRRTAAATTSRSRSSKKANKRTGSPSVYTTTLQLPIRLPTDKKTFIPTFHSCIASRVYVLHLALVVGIGATSTTLNLSLPLQVAVESEAASPQDMGLPSFEAAVQEAEADAHLQPRTIGIPAQEYMETSVLPGYGA